MGMCSGPTGTLATRSTVGTSKVIFKAASPSLQRDEVGQSWPATLPDTSPSPLITLFITFQIISTRCPDSIQSPSVMPRPSLCAGAGHRSEHRMFTQSSVRHEQNRSGRTLRNSTVAGTPLTQPPSPSVLSSTPAAPAPCLFLHFWHIVPLPMAIYSI